MRFSADTIERIKRDNRCDDLAALHVTLRKNGSKMIGPCPICSINANSKSAGRFEADADSWVCAVCCDGGDIIALYGKINGIDPKREFAAIVAALGGDADATPPAETPASARRAGARAFRKGQCNTAPAGMASDCVFAWVDGWNSEKRKDDDNDRYRERERKRLYENFWQPAQPWRGSLVETYLTTIRGVVLPDNACLGFHPAMPYFRDGREDQPELLHTGPAMLAPIWNARPDAPAEDLMRGEGYRFAGLHITYIDLTKAKGKLQLYDRSSLDLLPAKKVRGTKQGGYIDLGGAPLPDCRTMLAGEGIENTARGYTALIRAHRDVSRLRLRCAIDLGNIGGKARDRLAHPYQRDRAGRPKRVPGCLPDLDSAAMPVPHQIGLLSWMCDGDSDPFETRNAMRRGEVRRARRGLKQNFLWPNGRDWNDVA